MPQSHGVHGEKKNQNSILCGLCVSVAKLQLNDENDEKCKIFEL
jgi:hypothetical protein